MNVFVKDLLNTNIEYIYIQIPNIFVDYIRDQIIEYLCFDILSLVAFISIFK